MNDNPYSENSYASFVTTCKTHSVKRSNEGDRDVACKDTNSCLAKGANGSHSNEETSVESVNPGTILEVAIPRGIGKLPCEPSRSEETVDVSAYASSNADPKDIHVLDSKETCNRYTNAGIGKESSTKEAVEKTTVETGPKGES